MVQKYVLFDEVSSANGKFPMGKLVGKIIPVVTGICEFDCQDKSIILNSS